MTDLISIKRLDPSHAPEYRALLLEAFALHPQAYTSSLTERAALPLSWWEQRLAPGAQVRQMVLAAIHQQQLVGIAGVSFESAEKLQHKSRLFGMYVKWQYRRGGLGRQLVEAVLAQAASRPQVRLMQLTVTQGNPAQQLYELCGFLPFGLEPHAIAVERDFLAKVHMWRPLEYQPTAQGLQLSALNRD